MLKTTHHSDVSKDEFAMVLAALRAGIDPGKLTRQVAVRHPNYPGMARRIVDLASARLWLAEDASVADVLTMLECRRRFELSSADCRAYAVEILWAAEHEIDPAMRVPNPTSKEAEYAIA